MNTRPKYDPRKRQDSALEVTRAQAEGLALVALESAIVTHGLGRPHNLGFIQDVEQAVRDDGAVPATVGVLDGKIMVGMGQADLERLAYADSPLKISTHNLAVALQQQATGGTTLAATMFAASKREIKVVAAGGIGGVQIAPRFDISADLKMLAETPMLIVCSGAWSVFDFAATAEYLEMLGVLVLGYQTDKLPEFLVPGKTHAVSARVETPDDAAKLARNHWGMGFRSAVLLCQPIMASAALDRKEVEAAAEKASQDATQQGIRGPKLTPFLIKRVNDLTGGKALRANVTMALSNARLAAQTARVLAGLQRLQKEI